MSLALCIFRHLGLLLGNVPLKQISFYNIYNEFRILCSTGLCLNGSLIFTYYTYSTSSLPFKHEPICECKLCLKQRTDNDDKESAKLDLRSLTASQRNYMPIHLSAFSRFSHKTFSFAHAILMINFFNSMGLRHTTYD